MVLTTSLPGSNQARGSEAGNDSGSAGISRRRASLTHTASPSGIRITVTAPEAVAAAHGLWGGGPAVPRCALTTV